MGISRKGFLQGIGCAAAGATLGALADHLFTPQPPPDTKPRFVNRPARNEDSYSQCGEDRIVHFMCGYIGIAPIDYIDVGAHDPVIGNNTYLFYQKGTRGLLIEPNPTMCKKLREVRPDDRVLEAGIGATAAREADYYVMTDSSWNTFSKDEAERQSKQFGGKISIKEVIKVPLLDLNQVMAEHFREAPAFLSVDAQGFELPILKSIDYRRFRPKVICAETLVTGTREMSPEIAAFMVKQGYVVRGMSFVNTIFVDSKLL
jgi:FkbM family methyltransferase